MVEKLPSPVALRPALKVMAEVHIPSCSRRNCLSYSSTFSAVNFILLLFGLSILTIIQFLKPMFENWARLVVYLSKSDKLSSYCFRTEIVYIRYEFVRQHSGRMVGFTCDIRIHAYNYNIVMDSNAAKYKCRMQLRIHVTSYCRKPMHTFVHVLYMLL